MPQVQTTHPRALRCSCCGDLIGVYEPAVLVVDGVARSTSLAAEPPSAAGRDAATWQHRDCFAGAPAPAAR